MAYYPEVTLFEGFGGQNNYMVGLQWVITSSGAFPTINTTMNRRGGSAILIKAGSSIAKGVTTPGWTTSYRGTIGFNVRLETFGAAAAIFAAPMNAAANLATGWLGVTAGQFLYLARHTGGNNSVVVDTSAQQILVATDYYIEYGFTCGHTFGYYEVRVNGATIPTLVGTGATTAGSMYVQSVKFGASELGAGNAQFYISDYYYCNTISFLGDCRVDAYEMSADGANTGLTTVGSTSHYSNINDSLSVNTTNYNYGTVVKDTYAHSGMTHTPSVIYGSKQAFYANKNDAGARNINGAIRTGGANYTPGTAQALANGTAVGYYEEYNLTDPSSTNTAWAQAAWDAAEFGPNLT